MSARLASYNLYISRGVVDQENAMLNQLQMHKECAEDTLNDMLSGRIVVDAELATTITYPTVESTNDTA